MGIQREIGLLIPHKLLDIEDAFKELFIPK